MKTSVLYVGQILIRVKNAIVRKVKTMTQKQIYELKKKRRLQRQRRRNATVLIALVLLVLCTLFSCSGRQKPQIIEYETYIVKDGDTIWEIAQYYCGNSIDIRIAINQIEEINDISNSTIYNGDSLLVPVYSH